MSAEREIEIVKELLAKQAAKLDVLDRVVRGMLEASKENPDVAKAVSNALDEEYAEHLARPPSAQNPFYKTSIEIMREHLRKLSE